MCIGPDGGEIGILVQEKELARVELGGRRGERKVGLLHFWSRGLVRRRKYRIAELTPLPSIYLMCCFFFFPFLVLLSQFIFYSPSLREYRYRHLTYLKQCKILHDVSKQLWP